MTSVSQKNVILYAEDDFDDFESVEEAMQQVSSDYTLAHAINGTEVITYLESHADNPPCLLVLDLNMPVMDGKEVLKWIKAHPDFKKIKVMVFTTSSREEDVRLCAKQSCAFFRKPTLYRDLIAIVKEMVQLCE